MTTWALPFWILEDCVHRVSPREDGLIPVECQHSPSLADLREEGPVDEPVPVSLGAVSLSVARFIEFWNVSNIDQPVS